MLNKKYVSLVTELASYMQKHSDLIEIQKEAEFDLKWRLTELFKTVSEEDEQKFIDLSGMQGHLMTTQEKKELLHIEKQKSKQQEKDKTPKISEKMNLQKNSTDKKWAKDLYKRAIKRCHPDIVKTPDEEYQKELEDLYKRITASYEDLNLDILMIETYKLFVTPRKVIGEQIEILEESKTDINKKISNILKSEGYVWSTFDDQLKETFLINLMKQKGVRFVDKEKVKEVLKRKVNSRKAGQRPKNKLRERVKNKK